MSDHPAQSDNEKLYNWFYLFVYFDTDWRDDQYEFR